MSSKSGFSKTRENSPRPLCCDQMLEKVFRFSIHLELRQNRFPQKVISSSCVQIPYVHILFAFFSVLCWALKIRIDFIYFMACDFLVFLWPNSFILRCGIVMGDLLGGDFE
jgi:hypothetical protein